MGKNLAETREMAEFEAQLNRINQRTPFGSVTFTGAPGGRQTMTTRLAPAQQRLLNQQTQAQMLMGRQGQAQLKGRDPNAPVIGAGAGPSPFNLEALMGGNTDFSAERDRVEKATFDRAMALMNPEFARQEEAMQQRLANQGLPQASRAYGAETTRFGDARNRATEQAAMAATLAGGQEQSRLLRDLIGTSEAGVGQAMGLRQQDVSEALANRQIPFQELMALMTGVAPQQPNVLAPPATGLTSYAKYTPGGPGAAGGIGSALGTLAGAGLGGWLGGGLPGAALGAGLGGATGGAFGSLFG